MKKKSLLVLAGVLMMFVAAGCGAAEDKQKEDVTKAPAESVTKVPEENVKPTDAAEATKEPQEDEKAPYELSITFQEETEEATDGEFVYFMSGIHYPVFEGQYADNMNRFVTSLVEEFREVLPDAKESAYYNYEEMKNAGFGLQMFPETEELTVSRGWANQQTVVVKAEYYSYTGGAHPNMAYKAYVVDMTDGYKETFEAMIEPYGLTTEEVVDFAVARLREEHGEELFETDDAGTLKNRVSMFTETNQWYLNENGLVLFANPYDIAAYVYGVIECEISYEELEQGLKK